MRHTVILQAVRCLVVLVIINSVSTQFAMTRSSSSNSRTKRNTQMVCSMMGCIVVKTFSPPTGPNFRELRRENGKTFYLELKPNDGDISGK